jgi:hypothetical protein
MSSRAADTSIARIWPTGNVQRAQRLNDAEADDADSEDDDVLPGCHLCETHHLQRVRQRFGRSGLVK